MHQASKDTQIIGGGRTKRGMLALTLVLCDPLPRGEIQHMYIEHRSWIWDALRGVDKET